MEVTITSFKTTYKEYFASLRDLQYAVMDVRRSVSSFDDKQRKTVNDGLDKITRQLVAFGNQLSEAPFTLSNTKGWGLTMSSKFEGLYNSLSFVGLISFLVFCFSNSWQMSAVGAALFLGSAAVCVAAYHVEHNCDTK